MTAVSGRYTNTVTFTFDSAGRKKTEGFYLRLWLLLPELAIAANWDMANAENAVNEIELLKRLTRLEVGTWATETMVAHLRQANPRCLIVQREVKESPAKLENEK